MDKREEGIGVDSDGNLVLTYEVSVYCQGKRFSCLGTGCSDVAYFYGLVESGKVDTLKVVDHSFGYNVDVTMNGKALMELIKKYYPDKLDDMKDCIDFNEEYVIYCYDMS